MEKGVGDVLDGMNVGLASLPLKNADQTCVGGLGGLMNLIVFLETCHIIIH